MRSRTSVRRCVTDRALVAAERRTKKEQGFWPCSSLFSVLNPVLLVAETGAAAGERAEDFFPPKTWTARWSRSYAGILLSVGWAKHYPVILPQTHRKQTQTTKTRSVHR